MDQFEELFYINKDKNILCFYKIYAFLCKNIINKNIIITKEEILMIFNFFENPLDFKIDGNLIWSEYSIQKEIFKATIFFLEKSKEFKTGKNLKFKNYFLLLLQAVEFSSILKKTLHQNSTLLYKIYLTFSSNDEKELFKDKYFELYHITESSNSINSSGIIEDSFSFKFILNGNIEYEQNILGSKGDLLIIDQNFFLENYKILTSAYSEVIFIIKPNFIKDFGINIPKFYFKKTLFSLDKNNFSLILNKEKILLKNYFDLQRLALYLLTLTSDLQIEYINQNLIDCKNKILVTITNNISKLDSEIISLLLEELDTSLSSLYKLFYKIFEKTPTEVIESKKIDYACFFIISTEKKLEEISYLVGYKESTFYKKFVKSIGCSPSTFKKRYIRKNI
ncbi:MAG: helix-turn-helix domain-containing protein [Cetobacterium sp.]|uniref:helix-turn-helix domain-containing protein n=1 Tax=Cetobacterium sp. TaxID=2071632 RepID=UPI003F3A1F0D